MANTFNQKFNQLNDAYDTIESWVTTTLVQKNPETGHEQLNNLTSALAEAARTLETLDRLKVLDP